MEISLVVAKVLGVYLIVSGLFLIFRGKTVPQLLRDFFDHPAIMYLTGVILIFLSTLMLLENNIWDGTWRSVVTAFTWLILLKGLLYIFAPHFIQRMADKKLLETVSTYGLIAVIVGVSLFYLG
jgi:uncharacterized protein YjeT (DUF2065 family)